MPINWQIEHYQNVVSTQAYAHDAAAEGLPEGFVVQALRQLGGKGRHGNQWSSPIGNLYMSVLLRPDCGIAQAGELAFVVAVALSAALDTYIDPAKHTKTVKWPNDILIDGLKISGILLESNLNGDQLDSMVIGMGLNIFNAPDLAVGLNQVASDPVYVNTVRDTVLEKLSYFYSVWQEQGFEPIRKEWIKQAHGLGQPMTARLPTVSHKGIFKGITEEGSLILGSADEGEDKIIHAAEVHFGEKL